MEFREKMLIEQSVRGVVDAGGRYSEKEIVNQVSGEHPNADRDDISRIVRQVMSGAVYSKDSGTYGRSGS